VRVQPREPAPPLPSTPSPSPGFGSGAGSFGAGTNYPPSSDPYRSLPAAPGSTIHGSGYRSEASGPVIRAPELNSALPPSVRAVPDPDAQQPVAPINSAPQLLSPRDKMAASDDRRWAVVPAVWPSSKAATSLEVTSDHGSPRLVTDSTPSVPARRYDDSGWTSGR
jgi:hypothetical protein